MKQAPQKPIFFKKRDLILLVLLAVLAGFLFFMQRGALVPDTAVALVSVGVGEAQSTQRIPLSEEGIVHIEGGALPVQLSIENGGIRFINSVCPDHLCENFGILQAEGDWASCLPAEVFVRVEEADS